MKKPKLLLSVIAFGFLTQLLVAAPAQADWVVGIGNVSGSCVQFDWRGGTATFAGSGSGQFQVDVNNLFDNRIGGGSQADSWSIWVNDLKVVESNVIEQSQVSVSVAGDWVVTVQGIDVGFWAGWYGTMFCNPVFVADAPVEVVPVVIPDPPYVPGVQPTGDYRLDEGWGAHITAPTGMMIDTVVAWYGDPNDGNQGADWSQFYTEQLHGLVEADLNSGNYNGDPLPGVYKVLVASVFFAPNPAFVEPSVEVRPEEPPVVVVVPEPSPEPSNSPEPTSVPEPSVSPSSEPVTVVPDPIVVVPEPVQPPTVVIDPAPIDVRPETPPVVEVPVVVAPVVIPEPVIEPTPAPVDEPTAKPSPVPEEQTPAQTVEETATPTVDNREPTPSPEPESSVLPTLEPEANASAEPTPTTEPAPVQVTETVEPVRTHATVAQPETPRQETLTLPDNPTPSEIRAVIEEANTILNTAEQGSAEYVEALNALAEAAAADDPEVPEALADIPGVGVAAVAVLQAFNALGNLGADISPKVRKQMKQVGSAVIVMGITASAGVRRIK